MFLRLPGPITAVAHCLGSFNTLSPIMKGKICRMLPSTGSQWQPWIVHQLLLNHPTRNTNAATDKKMVLLIHCYWLLNQPTSITNALQQQMDSERKVLVQLTNRKIQVANHSWGLYINCYWLLNQPTRNTNAATDGFSKEHEERSNLAVILF